MQKVASKRGSSNASSSITSNASSTSFTKPKSLIKYDPADEADINFAALAYMLGGLHAAKFVQEVDDPLARRTYVSIVGVSLANAAG